MSIDADVLNEILAQAGTWRWESCGYKEYTTRTQRGLDVRVSYLSKGSASLGVGSYDAKLCSVGEMEYEIFKIAQRGPAAREAVKTRELKKSVRRLLGL